MVIPTTSWPPATSFGTSALREPLKQLRGMLAAIRRMEEAVPGADWVEGVVLCHGAFYRPGTTLSADPAAAHSERS